MPPLSLTPEAVPLLCQLLIAGTAAIYLLSLPRRTRATRWIGALLAATALFSAAYLSSTLAPRGTVWEVRSTLGMYAALLLSVFAGLQASYTFLISPFRRERRLVMGGLAVGLVAILAVTAWAMWRADVVFARRLLGPYGVALLVGAVWNIVVLGRKSLWTRALLAQSDVRQAERERIVQGIGEFMALRLLELALALLNAAVTFGLLPLVALQYGSLMISIVISVGFVILVINYAPEPTTVQAKLVGLVLATVLAVLGVASLVTLRPPGIAEDAGNVVPEQIGLRFEPREGGGYTLEQQRSDVAVVAPEDTQPVPMGTVQDGLMRVTLPFAFPFDGVEVREVFAPCVPVLVFDDAPLVVSSRGLIGSDRAAMFAFVVPSQPAEGVCLGTEVENDRVLLEWRRLDLAGRETSHRLALYPGGAFEVAYTGPRQSPVMGGAGFRLSGMTPYVPMVLSGGLPGEIPPGAGGLETYEEAYRTEAQARTLPFALLVLGATGFVLLLFPVFLRRGILDPLTSLLTGVERVQLGDLSARVPSRSSDELGLLARAFNGMAGSVQNAEARLRSYADGLEDRVVERTVELESSLTELRRTQGALVETEKMASLGRLTSGIAHEIKNPLNFIVNFADLQSELLGELVHAMENGDDTEAEELLADLAQNARAIQAHGSRADGIVSAMQLHARGAASGERIPTDLNAVLRLAVEQAEKRHPDQPPVEAELDESVGEVPVAPEGVLQAVVNLLDNALYASRQTEGDDTAVSLRSERVEGFVCIRVRDEGPGVAEEVRGRLFEPFVTTKPTGEGVGLGLSLAYGIVTAGHGGRLQVESQPGEGATFFVWLPDR